MVGQSNAFYWTAKVGGTVEMVVFAFFVFFSRELFGTSSLGHPESISSVGTKKSCTHVWHGPFKVLVIKLCNREGG